VVNSTGKKKKKRGKGQKSQMIGHQGEEKGSRVSPPEFREEKKKEANRPSAEQEKGKEKVFFMEKKGGRGAFGF